MGDFANRVQWSVFYAHIEEAAKQRGVTEAEICRAVAATGVTQVEADYAVLLSREAEVLEALKAGGLGISCINAMMDYAHRQQPEETEALVEMATRLGVRRVLAVPGFLQPGDEEHECLERMSDCLYYLCDVADAHGVTVGLEDFDGKQAPYATIAQLDWFFSRLPKLTFTLDTGNFFFSGEDVMDAIDRLGARIQHVHLKDRRLSGRPDEAGNPTLAGQTMYVSAIGDGLIPIRACLERLRALHYTGTLAVEHYGAPDQLATLQQSMKWLKKTVATL